MALKAAEREGRRHPVSFRTTEDIRERLERAASAAGRSLTQEIEYRLEQSFREEDLLRRYFGSDEAIELLKELSVIINYQLHRSGKSWRTDKATRDAIRAHFLSVFEYFDDEERAAKLQISREEYERRLKDAWKNPSPFETSELAEPGQEAENSFEKTAVIEEELQKTARATEKAIAEVRQRAFEEFIAAMERRGTANSAAAPSDLKKSTKK